MNHRFVKLIRRYPFLIRLPYLFFRRLQPRFTIGVVAVVFDKNKRVLLVEHVFHPNHPWGLPGGWIDRNEDPQVGVARELREELELTAIPQQIILAEKSFNNHIDLAYMCEATNEVGQLSYELLSFQWFDINQLPNIREFQRRAIQHAVKLTTGAN